MELTRQQKTFIRSLYSKTKIESVSQPVPFQPLRYGSAAEKIDEMGTGRPV